METRGGQRRLRMSTTIVNIGKGPFETRASRRSTATLDDERQPADLQHRRRDARPRDDRSRAVRRRRPQPLARPARRELRALLAPTARARPPARQQGWVLLLRHERLQAVAAGRAGTRKYLAELAAGRQRLALREERASASAGRTSTPGTSRSSGSTSPGLAAGDYLLKLTADPNGAFEELRRRTTATGRASGSPRPARPSGPRSGSGCMLPGASISRRSGHRPAAAAPNDSPVVDGVSTAPTGDPFVCPIAKP